MKTNSNVTRKNYSTITFNEASIISFITDKNGNKKVISSYKDEKWLLPSSICSISVARHNRTINFNRCPNPIRETIKSIFFIYITEGIEGRRKPKCGTILEFYKKLLSFLNFIEPLGISNLSQISPLICGQFLQNLISQKKSSGSIFRSLLAIEKLHYFSKKVNEPFENPWPDSSAAVLSGYLKNINKASKTLIIPDEILKKLFTAACKYLDKGYWYIELSREISHQQRLRTPNYVNINKRLKEAKFEGGSLKLNYELHRLMDACIIIIFTTSGMRVHELLSLKNDCIHIEHNEDGNYYWLNGVSEKTYEGKTRWMVSEITYRAVAVAKELSKRYQEQISYDYLMDDTINNSENIINNQIFSYKDNLFLGYDPHHKIITLLSPSRIRERINLFSKKHNIQWSFTTHQFRRTFANYVARNQLGDLRYLRQHFKHWSLDMSALYAANECKDAELYDFMLKEAHNSKQSIVKNWLEPRTVLAGERGKFIKTLRDRPIRTFSSRANMIDSISNDTFIRATGVAWCTSNYSGCNGGTPLDKTRCGSCKYAVIDNHHKKIWLEIYKQQKELLKLNDIGSSGLFKVKNDINTCKNILQQFHAEEGRK
jgi:integrase